MKRNKILTSVNTQLFSPICVAHGAGSICPPHRAHVKVSFSKTLNPQLLPQQHREC